ncbi:MAG: M56 family metallopeptidase [Chloroflexi bacterium]|nr:MAG: M56 family metallopeptidase [Chloroflexota bacterium]
MQPGVAVYEAYHFHLLYDVVLAVAGFAIILAACRVLAQNEPQLRARFFALAIGLPVFGELVAFTAYLIRPAPHTPLGQAMLQFHNQCGLCALLDEPLPLSTQPRWVLVALLVVGLISLARNGVGNWILGRLAASYPTFPIHSYPELQRLLNIAERHGRPLPRIAVSPHPAPLAVTVGFRQPAIIISQGMLRELNPAETETVLAHEMAHIIRQDNLWNGLLMPLRDALFFLPTSHLAWRQMVISQEEACDDLTIEWTGRPLDLARALIKAGQHPQPRDMMFLTGLFLVAPFLRHTSVVERRIERIIRTHCTEGAVLPPKGRTPLAIAVQGSILLLYALPILLGS